MMGQQKSEPQLFNYAVNLEQRVRANHPLRQVKATIDFSFVRAEVAHCYGKKGNESVAPEVILKMMFLLFFDDIKSERELMEVIGEQLDYLWFLDFCAGAGVRGESSANSETITILIVSIGIEKSSHLKLLIFRIVPPGLELPAF